MSQPASPWTPRSPVTGLPNTYSNSAYGNYALVKQVLADGNQIGTHSWDHPDFQNITAAQAQTENLLLGRSR